MRWSEGSQTVEKFLRGAPYNLYLTPLNHYKTDERRNPPITRGCPDQQDSQSRGGKVCSYHGADRRILCNAVE